VSDRRHDRKKRLETLVGVEPGSLGYHVLDWSRYLTARNYSPWSVESRQHHMRYFLVWCQDRGLTRPDEITVAVVERYQRWLAQSRKEDGKPLSFRSQRDRLATIRRFFRWMAKTRVIEMSPCETLDMPRIEKRLPKAILTVDEVETVMAVADVRTAMGLRDRAILETLYSTGLRRQEMCNLKIHDVDLDRGTLVVRQGKGKKDRMIPIGSRAVLWIQKYIDEVRSYLVREPDDGSLFLTRLCAPFSGQQMADMVRDHIIRSGVKKEGSCHLFRHTMATLMLEGGADIRFIQAMLGHASIISTEIYTQVAIRKLKEVYELTHPGAKLERRERPDDDERDELLSSLAAEAAEENRNVRPSTLTGTPERRQANWFLR
jgi:integrase/recombinase XerD